ncbi:N-6 DNA methylase [Desulfuromonas sp. CSMB_57]|uniref:N-6 DNA methylase n=1 Tax=Desulfuromonas sp. CSMB_57 TaxID=2807629 RepID=UPI001CD1C8C0|nr:N-6 DNA methylase [Desulfuromonas sp. CSMB_57]
MPITIKDSKVALSKLVNMAKNMPVSSRAIWQSRISHVYGDMKGQRAVDLTVLQKTIEVDMSADMAVDTIIALEAYFFLVCNLIAYASFQKNPSDFLRKIHSLPDQHFRSFLDKLISGALFEDEGVYGCKFAFDFDWILEGCNGDNLHGVRDALGNLSIVWERDKLLIPGCDPLQIIHHSLFPKNLLHITGQFYTPEWLAELLLVDVDWSPEKRLLDPFCGSGVFLVRALQRAITQGVTVNEVLPNLLGIDLNPIACAAARANLALCIGRLGQKLDSSVHLNIVSADSLAPAITKGQYKSSPLGLFPSTISIDGETVRLPDLTSNVAFSKIANRLSVYGLNLDNWIDYSAQHPIHSEFVTLSASDRRILEQFFVYAVKPADVVLTNPPWVGWEYISRSYRNTITDAWGLYDLFKVSGLDAAFLKEDISSLALMVAWDFYLKDKGKSAVVLRPATMHSELAARGVRRLSLADNGTPLCLEHIRTFSNIRVFSEANTDAATWEIRKGEPTVFPVNVAEWSKDSKRWNPETSMSLDAVRSRIRENHKFASRTDPNNPESRWLIADANVTETFSPLQGTNEYVPRMGVFTGGANAIFYMEYLDQGDTKETGFYRNIIERAKKPVPSRKVILERDAIFSVLRGRDIQMWHARPEVYLLCPHTRDTRMYPLEKTQLESTFPFAYQYLTSMQSVLAERQGFAGWEKDILKKYFYTLQRIGEYTFAPYKVCWKYIASEFTVCVVDGDDYSKPILPNDKVMFIPFESSQEAYFVCGILSSTAIRNYINSSASKRQISTNIIKSLALPQFDENNTQHLNISSICQGGHKATSSHDADVLRELRKQLDQEVSKIFVT